MPFLHTVCTEAKHALCTLGQPKVFLWFLYNWTVTAWTPCHITHTAKSFL